MLNLILDCCFVVYTQKNMGETESDVDLETNNVDFEDVTDLFEVVDHEETIPITEAERRRQKTHKVIFV